MVLSLVRLLNECVVDSDMCSCDVLVGIVGGWIVGIYRLCVLSVCIVVSVVLLLLIMSGCMVVCELIGC